MNRGVGMALLLLLLMSMGPREEEVYEFVPQLVDDVDVTRWRHDGLRYDGLQPLNDRRGNRAPTDTDPAIVELFV